MEGATEPHISKPSGNACSRGFPLALFAILFRFREDIPSAKKTLQCHSAKLPKIPPKSRKGIFKNLCKMLTNPEKTGVLKKICFASWQKSLILTNSNVYTDFFNSWSQAFKGERPSSNFINFHCHKINVDSYSSNMKKATFCIL